MERFAGALRTGLALLPLLWLSPAQGQLATNIGVDVKAMSMAHAVTADPPGIMSIHFNPAGLTRIEGRQLDLQFVAVDIDLNSRFSAPPGYGVMGYSDDPVVCADGPDQAADFCHDYRTGHSTIEGVSLYLPIRGDFFDLPSGPMAVGPLPSFAITPPGSRFTFASGIYAPMIAGFHRDRNDPGNFLGERVAINRITYLSPSVGYRISDQLSIGASIGFSYHGIAMETDFRAPNELLGFMRRLDESICAPFRGESNFALDIVLFGLCSGGEGMGPFKSLASLDIALEERLSPSWNVGILWEPSDRFAWGAVWHSPSHVSFKGRYKIAYANATRETINGMGRSPTGAIALAVLGVPSHIGWQEAGIVNMDLSMPAHFQTGIKWKPWRRLQLNVDAVWTDYSEWEAFDFEFDAGNAALSMARLFSPGSSPTSLYLPLEFESTWNLAFGMQYELTPRLRLRAGYEPRASAIPAHRRSSLVPINKANYYSVGLGYSWSDNTEIDLALAQLRSRDDIPADTSCMVNCTGLLNTVYNPYAGLDVRTEAVITTLGVAFRMRF